MSTEEVIAYEAKHPGVKRMREAFEATFGDMAGVMRAMNHWHNTRNEWNDAWNRDREKPITEVDVEAALQAVFAAVRARDQLGAEDIATRVCQTVADMDDRTSPEDWPEAMLVTGKELHSIVIQSIEAEAELRQPSA